MMKKKYALPKIHVLDSLFGFAKGLRFKKADRDDDRDLGIIRNVLL